MTFNFIRAPLVLAACCLLVAAAAEEKNRLLRCSIEATDIDKDCDSSGYLMSNLMWLIPAAITGVFTLVGACATCYARACCETCGGDERSKGWFLVGKISRPLQYFKYDIFRSKIYALGFLALAAWGFHIGLPGANIMEPGLVAFSGAPTSVANSINRELVNVEALLTVTRYNPDSGQAESYNLYRGEDGSSPIETLGEQLKEQVQGIASQDTISQIADYLEKSGLILSVLLGLPLGVSAIGACAAGCNYDGSFSNMLLIGAGVIGFLTWALHGITGFLMSVTSDICAELSGVSYREHTMLDGVASSISGCKDEDFKSFFAQYKTTMNGEIQDACKSLVAVCYDETATLDDNIQNKKVYSCPAQLKSADYCTDVTVGDLLTVSDDVFIHPSVEDKVKQDCYSTPGDPQRPSTCPGELEGTTCNPAQLPNGQRCTLQRCSDLCTSAQDFGNTTAPRFLSAVGKISKAGFTDLSNAVKIRNGLDSVGGTFESCASAIGAVTGEFITPCKEIVEGSEVMWDGFGVTALVMSASVCVFAWGSKRFISCAQTHKTKFPWTKKTAKAYKDDDFYPIS